MLRLPLAMALACRTLWFYHVPKTGGTSIVSALRRSAQRHSGEVAYFNLMARHTHMDKVPEAERPTLWRRKYATVRRGVLAAMDAGRIALVHHHHGGPGLAEFAPHLGELRRLHAARNCSLTVLSVFREPMEHAVSSFYFTAPAGALGTPAGRERTWRRQLAGQGRRGGAHLELDAFQIRYTLNNHRDCHQVVPIPFGGVNRSHACQAARLVRECVDVVGRTEELGGLAEAVRWVPGLERGWGSRKNVGKKEGEVPRWAAVELRRRLQVAEVFWGEVTGRLHVC